MFGNESNAGSKGVKRMWSDCRCFHFARTHDAAITQKWNPRAPSQAEGEAVHSVLKPANSQPCVSVP